MTRYYNENPQVTFWRERYEHLKEEHFKLLDDYESVSDSIDYTKYQSDLIKGRTEEAFRLFNSLPWWRKMFYKFNI